MSVSLHRMFWLLMASAVAGSGIGYSKIYLYHLVFVLFLFFWALLSFRGNQKLLYWPKNNRIYFLILFFLWYALGSFWSLNPLYTLVYIFYIFIGSSLVFLISAYIRNKERYLYVYKSLKIFSVLALVLALLESFTPIRLPTSPYSEYAALFGRSGTDFVEFESDIQALIKSAPTAFWGNPNGLAVAMLFLAPFFLMKDELYIKIIGIISILLVILMTGSRGSFISLLFGLFVYFLIRGVKVWFPVFIVGIISIIFVSSNIEALKNSENKRIAELASVGEVAVTYLFENSTGKDSIGSRQQLIRNGLDALEKSGGLGVGGGASVAVQEQVGGVSGKLLSMHNFWVEVLVEGGVVFFSLFVIWYCSIAVSLLNIYRSSSDTFYKYHSGSLFLAMTIFSISSVAASTVIYFFPMWIMYGLSISLISICRNNELPSGVSKNINVS